MQLMLGLFLAVGVSYAAYKLKSLNRSGALAATFAGMIIFGVGGWEWAILLLTFFITSSMLSRLFKNKKAGLDEKFSKGHERDAGQVFGNGGVAMFFAGLHGIFPEAAWIWVAFAAALAAVNADTWATELGVLNPHPPRLITKIRKQVEKGTSGAISLVGTAASFLGATVIGLLAVVFSPYQKRNIEEWTIITLAGVAGSLFDSYLGATVQGIYYCSQCDRETEKHPIHKCGSLTIQVRGWSWMHNDRVNFGCSLFACLLAILIVA